MAAVAAQPAVVRQPRVEEKPLATLGGLEFGRRAEGDLLYELAIAELDNRDGVREMVGHIGTAVIGSGEHGQRPAAHGDTLPLIGSITAADGDIAHAAERHDDAAVSGHSQLSRITRGIADSAEVKQAAALQQVGL